MFSSCHQESTSSSGNGASTSAGTTVIVSAAASAKDAVEEICRAYEAETGVRVQVNTGASSGLAAQIIAGAPVELFLSASQEWADQIADRQLGVESCTLLTNALVIVVPQGNPAGVRRAEDLASATVKRVALAGESVPAGVYAEQALKSLDLYSRLLDEKRIVRGQDVRVALSYVELGEAEAGIVYASDAKVSDQVETVYTFDAAVHEPIVYPLVLLKASDGKRSARGLYEFMQAESSMKIFEKHGFLRRPYAATK
jgi:molybdate transport system substrate-binding protein